MPPLFAGPGFNRADPLRARPDEIERLRDSASARALKWGNGAPVLDEWGHLKWGSVTGDEPLFLGFDGQTPCFSLIPHSEATINARAHLALIGLLDPAEAPTFAAALSLANWHRRHIFCSVSGHATIPNRGGWSRMCAACGAEHYPRVDPVVIMLAEHDGRLLLGRQPAYPPGRYSALAGYVEPGEAIEDAVARELFEEAGIAVTNVRYVASQPWPFPSTLMIGAIADAADDALTIDTHELDDARWFSRDQLAAALAEEPGAAFLPPPPAAIARTLLDRWLAA